MNTDLQLRNRKYFYYILLIIGTVFRIGIMLRTPFYAIGGALADDQFYLARATALLSGEWLGSYNKYTLVKGISYAVFIALSKIFCMPYALLLALFYVVAILIFIVALRDTITKGWQRLIVYFFMLYNPIGFSFSLTQRLYRNALLYPAIVLTVSCLLGAFLHRNDVKERVFWLVGSGIAYTFFYYLREDSIWLMPLFLVSLLLTLIYDKLDKRCNPGKTTSIIIPILIFVGLTTLYSGLNNHYYGVFAVTDRTQTNFGKLVGNMLKVDNGMSNDTSVWLSRRSLAEIIDNCPTLYGIRDDIINTYTERVGNDHDDIRGDHYVWALRDGLERAGYYSNAREVDEFCARANEELLSALNSGKLKKSDKIYLSSQSRGIEADELPTLAWTALKNLFNCCMYKDITSKVGTDAVGTDESIRMFEAVTGNLCVYPTKRYIAFSGWIITKDKHDITIRLLDKDGNVIWDLDNFNDSQDVKQLYPDYSNSDCARFSEYIEIDRNVNDIVMEIIMDGSVYYHDIVGNVDDEQVMLTVDSWKNEEITDYEGVFNGYICNIGNGIIKIYKLIAIPLNLMGCMAYVVLFWAFLRKKNIINFQNFIIPTGVLLSAFILEFGVTCFSGFLGESAIMFYSSGVVPMWHMFLIYSMFMAANIVIKRNKTIK